MKIGAQIGLWKGNLNAALKDISNVELEGIETFTDPWVNLYYDKPSKFHSLLSQFNVTLSGMYYGGDFITPETQTQELKRATKVIRFLKAVGGEFLILNSGSARNEKGYPMSAYDQLAETMNKIGEIGREYSIKVACHPHVGTMVETRKQLDLLMERLNPELVGLCPHAAHFLYTGTDPYDIYKTYADRVVYVHVSDMRGGAPTNLGQGEIDQRALMEPLLKAGFDGWIIIEGIDPKSTPLEGIKVAAEYVRKELCLRTS